MTESQIEKKKIELKKDFYKKKLNKNFEVEDAKQK